MIARQSDSSNQVARLQHRTPFAAKISLSSWPAIKEVRLIWFRRKMWRITSKGTSCRQSSFLDEAKYCVKNKENNRKISWTFYHFCQSIASVFKNKVSLESLIFVLLCELKNSLLSKIAKRYLLMWRVTYVSRHKVMKSNILLCTRFSLQINLHLVYLAKSKFLFC